MSALYAPAEVLWARLLKRVTVTESGCWEFQGSVTSRGYGSVGAGRKSKSITAHRLAVIVRDGGIADGMTVDHMCHNADRDCKGGPTCRHRRCVNPEHLSVCDLATNTGRRTFRAHWCPKGHRREVTWDGDRPVSIGCECAQELIEPVAVAWLDTA